MPRPSTRPLGRRSKRCSAAPLPLSRHGTRPIDRGRIHAFATDHGRPRRRLTFAAAAGAADPEVYRGHGIAMHGDLKYGPDFKHFDYVNPAAPKGGALKQSAVGTFDSFNPFIIKGNPAAGIGRHLRHAADVVGRRAVQRVRPAGRDDRDAGGSLLGDLHAAPGGALARRQAGHRRRRDLDASRRCAAKGKPFYRGYYAQRRQGREDRRAHACKFTFKPGENRELPLILGQLAVLPKHYWAGARLRRRRRSSRRSAAAPYKVDSFEAGRCVTYGACRLLGQGPAGERRAQQLRRHRATTTIATTPSRSRPSRPASTTSASRTSAKDWATAYDVPGAAQTALMRKEEIPNDRPAGMQGFAFNIAPPAVPGPARARRRSAYAFDFEWSNKNALLRPVHAHAQLLRQLRARRQRVCRAPRSWRSSSRSAARFRRRCSRPSTSRRRPTAPATSATICARPSSCCARPAGRSIRRRSKLTNAESGQPMEFEILLVRARLRAHHPAVHEEPRAARHRRERAHRRHLAVPAPHRRLRLRHDRRRVAAVAVARQRAARLLGLGVRRPARAARTSSASRIRWSTR